MLTKSQCIEWLNNPLKNPKSNKPIKLNGPTYTKIKNQCSNKNIKKSNKKNIKKSNKKNIKKSNKKNIKKSNIEGICDSFMNDKSRNPRTNAKIKKNGPTFKKLEDECAKNPKEKKTEKKVKKSNKKKSQDGDVCQLFQEDKSINPESGRVIKPNGPTFRRLIKMCQEVIPIDSPLPKDMPNNKLNMIIRKVAKPRSQLLGGTALIEYLSLTYLLTKHKNNCAPVIQTVPDSWLEGKQYNLYQLIITIGKTYHNIKGKKNEYKGYVPIDFFKQFNTCNKRFVISLLRIEWNKVGHANGLIYDRKTQTLERFEPHGNVTIYDSVKLDRAIIKMFKKFNIPIKKYYKPLDFCPIISFQGLEANSKTNKLDPLGFCSYWSTWYMDMRLSNPNLDKKTLVSESIKLINTDYDSFKDYIRSYAVFINHVQTYIIKELSKKKLTHAQKTNEMQKIVAKLIQQTKIV